MDQVTWVSSSETIVTSLDFRIFTSHSEVPVSPHLSTWGWRQRTSGSWVMTKGSVEYKMCNPTRKWGQKKARRHFPEPGSVSFPFSVPISVPIFFLSPLWRIHTSIQDTSSTIMSLVFLKGPEMMGRTISHRPGSFHTHTHTQTHTHTT